MKNFETTKAFIEEKLCELVASKNVDHHSLYEAAQYSLLSPAKRLRPLIVLELARHFGVSDDQSLIPALTIELIHTYTLIHDDLPCMDDETLRRGKPPLHHAFPEGEAVLTGDFLLTYAFELISQVQSLSATVRIELVQALSKRIGDRGLIAGQILDLYGPIDSKEQFIHMAKLKTAELFCACFEFGAILGNAPPLQREKLLTFAELFGLAFQYIDDLDDQESDESSALNFFSHAALMEEIKAHSEALKKLEQELNIPLLSWLLKKINSRICETPQTQALFEKTPSV